MAWGDRIIGDKAVCMTFLHAGGARQENWNWQRILRGTQNIERNSQYKKRIRTFSKEFSKCNSKSEQSKGWNIGICPEERVGHQAWLKIIIQHHHLQFDCQRDSSHSNTVNGPLCYHCPEIVHNITLPWKYSWYFYHNAAACVSVVGSIWWWSRNLRPRPHYFQTRPVFTHFSKSRFSLLCPPNGKTLFKKGAGGGQQLFEHCSTILQNWKGMAYLINLNIHREWRHIYIVTIIIVTLVITMLLMLMLIRIMMMEMMLVLLFIIMMVMMLEWSGMINLEGRRGGEAFPNFLKLAK